MRDATIGNGVTVEVDRDPERGSQRHRPERVCLTDPARVKIMSLLLNTDEICACDVATGIGKTAASASHHLKLLRDAGLVTGDKRGTWIYYRAVPSASLPSGTHSASPGDHRPRHRGTLHR